jgi:hypothetical protein
MDDVKRVAKRLLDSDKMIVTMVGKPTGLGVAARLKYQRLSQPAATPAAPAKA